MQISGVKDFNGHNILGFTLAVERVLRAVSRPAFGLAVDLATRTRDEGARLTGGRAMGFRAWGAVALLVAGPVLAGVAQAADLRIGLQAGGTAAWEVAAMQALGIDGAHDLTLTIRDLADSRAGQVALQAGEVDVILSDYIWVSLQRHQGADFTIVPHSLAVGGLMAQPGGKVAGVADLKGARLAVAGGPVDKSYLILQAYYAAQTGGDLVADASTTFGAPPLVNEQLEGGGADAALNFWHFNARAAVAGAVEVVSVKEMLAELGVTRQPPLLGWTFHEGVADSNPAIRAYLDASFETKSALMRDDALWLRIRPEMGVEDDALFIALRDAYRAGIVTGYGAADIEAATQAYALLSQYGGAELTSGAEGLAAGTFWAGYER
jgi:NitT/TauT family transport system substrate-binding protein